MELFINDLSLHAQYAEPASFYAALKEILGCRSCATTFRRNCYVPRSISQRHVSPGQTFRQMVMAAQNKELTRAIMQWIDRQGPFADDHLTRSEDEYYTRPEDEQIVTEEILGEAAARAFASSPASLVSFAPSDYARTPITVRWHHSDAQHEDCEIPNFWQRQQLAQFLADSQEEIQSWPDLIARAQAQYTNLTFLPSIGQGLEGEPFSTTIARRAFELLGFLNTLKGSYTASGQLSPDGEQIYDNLFRRELAIFTDASETEKNDAIFRERMTFTLPDGTRQECFWHGKIKHRYYRMHFSPLAPERPLYIAYLGPKLTKH